MQWNQSSSIREGSHAVQSHPLFTSELNEDSLGPTQEVFAVQGTTQIHDLTRPHLMGHSSLGATVAKDP